MTDDIAIKVENLSKCYHIYDQPRHRLLQMMFRGHKQFYREFWALKDVSFEIQKGETVGIIGRNGSGKSTLLQMICGTLNPTYGIIETKGRIAALLELGSGFNPEFTGRENVFMNATVLGLSRNEIEARFEEIASFADIGDFIEQPVKSYSSGMIVRLAFAVAINVEPDILIVDEALSVGDELFQRKCFSRIETIRNSGATILFVSHSGGTVVELCDRALLLDAGERLATGRPKSIVGRYQKLLYVPKEKRETIRAQIRLHDEAMAGILRDADESNEQFLKMSIDSLLAVEQENELPDSYDPTLKPQSTIAYESHGAFIHHPEIYTEENERVNNLTRGKVYIYRYRVVFDCSASNVRFGMMIKTASGLELGGAATAASNRKSLPFVTSGSSFMVEFRFMCRLNSGVYFLNAGVVGDLNGSETYLHRLVDAAMLRVMSETQDLATGVVDFACAPRVYQLVESKSDE